MIYGKLGVLAVRYARLIFGVWLLLLTIFGAYAVKLPSVLKDHGLKTSGSYSQVQHILTSEFGYPENTVVLLFEKQETVSREQFHRFIAQTLSLLQGLDGHFKTVSPLHGEAMEKGNAAYALLFFRQKEYEMGPVIRQLQQLLPRDQRISVKLTGKAVVQEDVNRISQADLKRAEEIGIPIAFAVLWLSFGGAIAALIPVLVGWTAVTSTMGMMELLGRRLELSIFVLNVIPMVGLALSIDFALLVVSRFREELQRLRRLPAGEQIEQALVITMGTAGRAVVFSALCVGLGLGGTLFIRMPIFNTVALGAMAVLAMSVLATLTLVPALLSILGRRFAKEEVKRAVSVRTSFWYRLSGHVMKRPVRTGLLAVLVLSGFIWPIGRLSLAIPDASSLPKGTESRTAAELFADHFASPEQSQAYLIVTGTGPTLQARDWLNASLIAERLSRDPELDRVDSVFSLLPLTPGQLDVIYRNPGLKMSYGPELKPFIAGNHILFSVILRSSAGSQAAMDWARRWEHSFPDIPLLVGGEPKYQQEVFDEIFNHLGRVLLFIFVSNFIILLVAFRSVLIPLKTILMNLLSLGASFGFLTWVFEGGHFGLEPSAIAVMIPVFIFGLTFGISMDYGVFLLSRIAEEYRRTGDNSRSVREGLAITGRIITGAAAILIVVTAPFALAGVSGVKQLGLGIAAAILVDATVIRMMLVPSLMKLLGKWNWWGP